MSWCACAYACAWGLKLLFGLIVVDFSVAVAVTSWRKPVDMNSPSKRTRLSCAFMLIAEAEAWSELELEPCKC